MRVYVCIIFEGIRMQNRAAHIHRVRVYSVYICILYCMQNFSNTDTETWSVLHSNKTRINDIRYHARKSQKYTGVYIKIYNFDNKMYV